MNTIKTISAAIIASTIASTPALARDLTIEITNLTHGMYFTPRLAVAHTDAVDLFTAGMPASEELERMAEGGSLTELTTLLDNSTNTANNDHMTFGGLVAPGEIKDYSTWTVDNDFTHLSLVSMLVPTNDAFLGLDSWEIPTEPGTYMVNINAYDAGTELNDEINSSNTTVTKSGSGEALGGGPDLPGMAVPDNADLRARLGSGATGVAAQVDGANQIIDGTDGNIHIHRNALGDLDSTGGASDLDAKVHRWLNPVARIKVVVAN